MLRSNLRIENPLIVYLTLLFSITKCRHIYIYILFFFKLDIMPGMPGMVLQVKITYQDRDGQYFCYFYYVFNYFQVCCN